MSKKEDMPKIKFWAHRGMSKKYPENTLSAFLAAAKVEGLTGVELDVHLSNDGEVVVIHNETVDETTNGRGLVRDYGLEELKSFRMTGVGGDKPYIGEDGSYEHIPTLREVFAALKPYCESKDLKINIELKNNKYPYPGMEEKVVGLVREMGMEKHVIFSSFNAKALRKIRKLLKGAHTGYLCTNEYVGYKKMRHYRLSAIHPSIKGLDTEPHFVNRIKRRRVPVRIWNNFEPFYGQNSKTKLINPEEYARLGVTDIITNVPDVYLLR